LIRKQQSTRPASPVSPISAMEPAQTVCPKRAAEATEVDQLIEAAERASEAIARILQDCGSSCHFGPDERRQFERLLRHRRLLVARLDRLRVARHRGQ
jgi:hypothetical protein